MAIKHKPSYDGIIESLENLDIPFRSTFADIMGNHWLGELTPDTVQVCWEFRRLDSRNLYEFIRYEKNSTGAGMDQDTLELEFFGSPAKYLQNVKRGVSMHGVGEKVAYAKLTKDAKEYRSKRGIKTCTKTKEMDKYLVSQFNMYDTNKDNNGYILETDEYTKDEVRDMGIPVDEIGDSGTYTSYIISGETNTFYQDTKDYLENIFMNYLKDKKMTINFKLFDVKGNIIDDSNLEPKIIPYDTPNDYTHYAFQGNIKFDSKVFPFDIGKRPVKDSQEMYNFKKEYGNRRALAGRHLNESIAKNIALLMVDKDTGYIYSIQKVSGEKNLSRVTMIIYVSKDDIGTNTVKSRCYFKKLSGKVDEDASQTHKIIKAAAREYYPDKAVTENDIRDYLVQILRGEKKIHKKVYEDLCEHLDIPVGDYEWAKQNVNTNKEVLNKKLDIYIESNNHIIELKTEKPDGDKDFNQILCYSTLIPNVKKVTTFALSVGKEDYPETINSDFPTDTTTLFTTKLNNHETTKHINWELLDLRYFDLHLPK